MTTKAQVTDITESILAAILEGNKVKAQQVRVNTRREGICTVFTRLAVENGQATFTKAMDTVFDAIRTNKEGVAEATKCEPSTKKEGQWLIPSTASSAKSVLLSAFEHNVSMLDEEDKTLPYKTIQTAVREAKALKEQSSRTDAEVVRDNVVGTMTALAERLGACDVDPKQAEHMLELADLLEAWESDHAGLSGEETEEAEADAAADAAAEADLAAAA